MRIKDAMTRDVKHLSPQMSAKDGLRVLFEMQISGLPVIDEQGRLVGMFTEKDVLAAILPSYLERVGNFVYEENPKGIKKKVAQLENVKIRDIMRKEVVTINEDATLSEVARIMLTQKVRRIPVLNKAGAVVGIVARQDVMRKLVEYAK